MADTLRHVSARTSEAERVLSRGAARVDGSRLTGRRERGVSTHPMNATGSIARIVILSPAEVPARQEVAGRGASVGSDLGLGGASRDTFAALNRLAGEIELEVARDAASCLAAARSARVGLVLLDRVTAAEARRVLDALQPSGPPVVVITEETAGVEALEAARDGAAQCVRAGSDYAEVLPVVVLEQLQHSRGAGDRLQRSTRDLQRYTDGILEDLPCALVVLDCEGRILTANATASELLDRDGGGLEGRRMGEWLAPDSDGLARIARTLAQGVRFRGVEAVLRWDDGRAMPVGLSCSPRVVEGHVSSGQAGRIGRGAVVVFQDLSEIRGLQHQLLQTEKMASIGLLAAGVAHEINNPVGFIHANLFQMGEYLGDLRQIWERVEQLQSAAGAGDRDEIRAASDALSILAGELDFEFVQRDFLKAVRESQDGAERIRHIVQDLRDFSRNDSDSFEYSDVNQCLEATVSIASTMIKHSAVLEKQYSALPKLRCYPAQLKQVFLNLLVNAYQAVEERLAGAGGLGKIQICSECRDSHAVISIRDTGTGIAPSDVNRIFDPFFTTREVGAGSGLGLATCYSIVKRHGGRIEVSSEVGEGTTFEIWLPLGDPETGGD
jgi:signal transduction histidine kinase